MKTPHTVKIIHLIDGSLNNVKPWLIRTLPNMQYLALSDTEIPLAKTDLVPILTKQIQSLNILTSYSVEQLTKISNIYFSNVQDIQLTICFKFKKSEIYANEVKKIVAIDLK